MRKIPTLFQRDPENLGRVTGIVTPGCEWVIDGEGVPTRKFDGTCVMRDAEQGPGWGVWWARREVKPGKPRPDGFWPEGDPDPNTGKTVGWVPASSSGFAKFLDEAIANYPGDPGPGTYELVGPKINGNPENCDAHQILRHGQMIVCGVGGAGLRGDHRTADPLDLIEVCRQYGMEGIVWHHPDGRMAKLKVRDYDKGL